MSPNCYSPVYHFRLLAGDALRQRDFALSTAFCIIICNLPRISIFSIRIGFACHRCASLYSFLFPSKRHRSLLLVASNINRCTLNKFFSTLSDGRRAIHTVAIFNERANKLLVCLRTHGSANATRSFLSFPWIFLPIRSFELHLRHAIRNSRTVWLRRMKISPRSGDVELLLSYSKLNCLAPELISLQF